MKFLLTNDDGIDAPGIVALADAVHDLGEVIVVAPHQALSGCSHQATTSGALEVHERRPNHFAVSGTPVDCVRLALWELAPDVDVVLSGINDGANLGADIWFSGTVAGAREAAFLGRRAIAISQYRRGGGDFSWPRAGAWTREVLNALLPQELPSGAFWNVNLPDVPAPVAVPAVVPCDTDECPLPVEFERREGRYFYSANYHQRERAEGTDVAVCFGGAVAVTQIRLSGR